MTALDDAPTALTGTGTRIVHGTCHHDCPDSCGWHVTVDDRVDEAGPQPVAVQLRGNPAHPYSQGELCPKVNRFLDRVYSPDRITTPMRRVGPKGEGRFEPITWDEALTEIATRFQAIVAEHGAEAILPYSDAGNQSLLAMGYTERFWNRLGATRLVRALCGPTVGAGAAMTNGTKLSLDPMEMRHSKLIILWATNTRLTNRHLWPIIEEARADGAQVIVIDPIRTMTAESADWFLQPLPGTDIALMLAMMRVLFEEDLVDHEWVAAHTHGADELRAHVAEWTPEHAAAVTGIAADDIVELARRYGTIRPSAIRTLVGAEHHENGAMFFRTLVCLPALVGAWRDRGGGYARSIGSWTDPLIDGDALECPHLLGDREPRWLNMSRLGEILTDDTLDPPVKAMVVWNANPMVVTPNAEAIRRGMERHDLFTVVHEHFLTDTALYADLVLPATTQIEAIDVVPSWGSLYLGWNEGAIPPVGESVSNSEFHRRLAGAMGFTDPELFEDDLSAIRGALPTVDVDTLRDEGFVRVPYPDDGRPFADGGFPTASGKVELWSDALVSMGQPALPTYVAPRESLGGDAALAARFPFQLLTPKQHTRFLNSSYSHLPKHGPLEGGPYVELCAADAERLGVTEGQHVAVHNDRASLTLPVKITGRLRPNVAAIPWGWWSQHHPDGKVANALTNDTLTDWGGGVAYSDTLVAITVH
jgi:anaerobic selenocysteine-containing dehydrogenase